MPKSRTMVYVTGFLSFIAFGSSALAQHPLVLQKLKDWNAAAPQPSSDTLLAQVKVAAQQKYPESGSCLAQGITLIATEPATADRYVLTEVAYGRMKNAWTVTVRHEGCDSALVRYMVMQKTDGQMSAIRVNRGVSYAHDSLIGDTLSHVTLASGLVLKRQGVSCDERETGKLGITRVDKEDSGLGPSVFGVRYSGSWSEIWPIEKCGHVIEIPVSFTADGDGGAYHRLRIDPKLRASQMDK